MIDNRELMVLGLTALNGYLLIDEGSRLDKIVLATTGALVIDFFVTPWFANGRTFHEVLGLSSNEVTNLQIYLWESGLAAAGVVYMSYKNLSNYLSRRKQI